MVGYSNITYCDISLNRIMRQVITMLVAYGMAAHLILFAFAVTAMSVGMQGQGDFLFAGSASTQRLIMVLCRPSTLWTDGTDANDADMPDGTHLRGCCGVCAVQSAGLWDAPADYFSISPYRESAELRWLIGAVAVSDCESITPSARGPPVV